MGSSQCRHCATRTGPAKAMPDVEAALAVGGARVGLLPEAAATSIAAACRNELYDVAAIARGAATDATP